MRCSADSLTTSFSTSRTGHILFSLSIFCGVRSPKSDSQALHIGGKTAERFLVRLPVSSTPNFLAKRKPALTRLCMYAVACSSSGKAVLRPKFLGESFKIFAGLFFASYQSFCGVFQAAEESWNNSCIRLLFQPAPAPRADFLKQFLQYTKVVHEEWMFSAWSSSLNDSLARPFFSLANINVVATKLSSEAPSIAGSPPSYGIRVRARMCWRSPSSA
mmetsp:Transcript_95999/g.248703  ORF Transcript_95999/g.248703 Transcript_95999/m.248703 type:complete len:217 (+) Transcript_95999:86-736(+)